MTPSREEIIYWAAVVDAVCPLPARMPAVCLLAQAAPSGALRACAHEALENLALCYRHGTDDSQRLVRAFAVTRALLRAELHRRATEEAPRGVSRSREFWAWRHNQNESGFYGQHPTREAAIASAFDAEDPSTIYVAKFQRTHGLDFVPLVDWFLEKIDERACEEYCCDQDRSITQDIGDGRERFAEMVEAWCDKYVASKAFVQIENEEEVDPRREVWT